MDNKTEPIRLEEEGGRAPTPLAGSVLYLLVLLLMMLNSIVSQRIRPTGNFYYIYMLLVQIATIGLPSFLYLIIHRMDIRKTVRWNKIRVSEALLCVGMAFFGYGVIVFVNLLWTLFLNRFGTPPAQQLPPIESGSDLLVSIIVIAGIPALLEEFLFRGTIQRGYERFGKTASILLTGILFALLHLDIASIPSILPMGVLLCFLTYRADSLFAGAIYHFTNNIIAVTITYLSGVISRRFPMEGVADSLTDIPPDALKMAVAAWGVTGIISFVLFLGCLIGFYRITEGKQKVLPADPDHAPSRRFLQLFPAILAVVIILILLVFQVVEMIHPLPAL